MVTKRPLAILRSNGSQILAAILLALVLHGATAGLTHNHARTSGARTSSAEQNTTPAVNTNTPVSNAKISNCECLICQLHHNLSITLVAKVASLEPGKTSSEPFARIFSFYAAELFEQSHGRAPPLSL
jgi:hypothetical protein